MWVLRKLWCQMSEHRTEQLFTWLWEWLGCWSSHTVTSLGMGWSCLILVNCNPAYTHHVISLLSGHRFPWFPEVCSESDECAHKSIMRSNVRQGTVIRFLFVCFCFIMNSVELNIFWGNVLQSLLFWKNLVFDAALLRETLKDLNPCGWLQQTKPAALLMVLWKFDN